MVVDSTKGKLKKIQPRGKCKKALAPGHIICQTFLKVPSEKQHLRPASQVGVPAYLKWILPKRPGTLNLPKVQLQHEYSGGFTVRRTRAQLKPQTAFSQLFLPAISFRGIANSKLQEFLLCLAAERILPCHFCALPLSIFSV